VCWGLYKRFDDESLFGEEKQTEGLRPTISLGKDQHRREGNSRALPCGLSCVIKKKRHKELFRSKHSKL
jgi:hypothetical protein